MKTSKFQLRQLLTAHKFWWVLAWLLGVATALSVLALAMVSGWLVSVAVVGASVLTGFALYYLLPAMLALIRTTARYGDLMVSHHTVFGLLKELRVRFFAKWAKQPPSVRHALYDSSSQKMHRLVKDIDVLDEFVLRVVSPWVVAGVSVLAVLLLLLALMPASVVVMVLVVLAVLVAILAMRQGIKLAYQEASLLEQRKSTLIDTLPAMVNLLIWQCWQDRLGQIITLSDQYDTLNTQAQRLRRRSGLLIQLLMAGSVLGFLILVHGFFVNASGDGLGGGLGMPSPALVLALVLGLLGLAEVILMMAIEPLSLGRGLVAKRRINALITSSPDQLENQPKTDLKTHTPDWSANEVLKLAHVRVQMPQAIKPTQSINAVLPAGEPVLITGVSGAGKSTLLLTLAGEIAPKSGHITLGGADYTAMNLGTRLGFLGQTVDIFDQTLADNLRLGKPNASDEELLSVLDKVGLSAWLAKQPKGLDTPLGEYGMAISGGQARRVALARLLLTDKAILLLDEPFAGLDSQTRQQVWDSLMDLQKQGKIGILAIATHQLWGELYTARRIVVQ